MDQLQKLLFKLKALCNAEGYSILDVAEILQQSSDKLNEDNFISYIKYLTDNEYIDVKYFDKKQICMAILQKANNLGRLTKSSKSSKSDKRSIVIIAIVSAIGAFLGGFLGSLVCGVIG